MYEVKAYTFKKFLTKKGEKPIPFVKMAGFVLRETPKAYYMRCRGELFSEKTMHCMRCGKIITNPVSQFFGLGPSCGCHNYENPFNSDRELKEAIKEYREGYLHKVIWEGWVPKSGIIEEEKISYGI